MPDPDEPEAYFSVVQADDGYSVLTDMDTDELEEVQHIIEQLMTVRLSDETPERLH